jgi:hypothetical protein
MNCKNIIFPADLADWLRKISENLCNLRETISVTELNLLLYNE